MSTSTPTRPSGRGALWRRKELVMAAILLIVGLVLLIGAQTMHVLGDSAPGPRFVPVIVGVALLVVAVILATEVIRHPEEERVLPDEGRDISRDLLQDLSDTGTAEFRAVGVADLAEDASPADPTTTAATSDAAEDTAKKPVASDLRTTGYVLASLVGFVLILPWAGWVLSAAALFWCVARALGSRRTWIDLGVALLLSSFIQLVFGGLLGLSLPVLLGGVL
ncbi:tripartite tricarboxylate transporter TctB family protein [Brachybacterium squillarum]|uniref:tripartite tricarboxylate transporter TctB family protein n=1 Tax=Brachybacterium squillarum TaxID=661979 RepID=UPI002221E26F|nr:tripartite tricarboxylate transporter TctB family protein [Brachybacterium squillarum]MCW1806477.1 tripartite tricarboxylate transporter TctB family protein [Brachybacterium squillarum]